MQCQASLGCTAKGFIQFHYSWILKTQDGNGFATLKCIVVHAVEDLCCKVVGPGIDKPEPLLYLPLHSKPGNLGLAKSRWLFRVPTSMFCFFFSELLQCRVLFLQCNTANCDCPLLQAIFIHVFVPRADISDCYL